MPLAPVSRLRRTYTTALLEQKKRSGRRRLAVVRALLYFSCVLLLGGAIFSALERDNEVRERQSMAGFLTRMQAALPADEFSELVGFLAIRDDRVAEELHRGVNLSTPEIGSTFLLAPHDWDFVGAFFFCFTAATTIGYGNYTPRTSGGKAFLVVYAFVAIPACLSAFAEISDRALEHMQQRFRRRMIFEKRIQEAFQAFEAEHSGGLQRAEATKAIHVLGYTVGGSGHGDVTTEQFEHSFAACDLDGDGALSLDEFRAFVLTVAPDAAVTLELVLSKGYVVLLAAATFGVIVALSTLVYGVFYEREDWSPLDALYFTIVTFTTIGFGDFSPDPHPGWFACIFIVVTFVGHGITATLVRAAYDPAFNAAATARGLAPRQWAALVAIAHGLRTRVIDVLGLPASWRPSTDATILAPRRAAAGCTASTSASPSLASASASASASSSASASASASSAVGGAASQREPNASDEDNGNVSSQGEHRQEQEAVGQSREHV
jgi:voltage-gated potassium channel